MSANVGSLNVNATLQTAAFDKGVNQLQGKLKSLQGNFASVGSKLSSIGKGMSIGITAPFAALMSKAIPAAKESREAIGQVNAALASMGPVAGRTSEQLQGAAKSLQGLSTFDDDDIMRKVTANMLTFGNVAGAQFDRAQLAAVNLATRLGGDLQGATMMIGKALNSPAEGIAKLSRAGIQFTDQQKAQIVAMTKAGDAAGAQSIMLAELERQFGGSAAAMRAADPAAALTNTWNDFMETIGEIALKVLPPLTDALDRLLSKFNDLSPGQQKFAIGAVAVGAAVGPVMMVLGPLVKVMGTLLPLLLKLGPAISLVGKALVFVGANPIILGIAGVVGGIYLAWKNWDKIQPIVQKMVAGVTSWLSRLSAPFKWVIDQAKMVGDAFFRLYDRVVGHSYVPDLVDGIRDEMARLDAVMVKPVKAATATATQAFQELQERVSGLLGELFPEQAAQNLYNKQLSDLEAYAAKAGWSVERLAEAVERLKIARGLVKIDVQTVEKTGESNITTLPGGDMGGQLVKLLQTISPSLQRIGDVAGGVFGGIADAIVRDVIPAIETMGKKTMEVGEKFATIGNAFGALVGAIFGNKAGKIAGSVAQIGLNVGKALGAFGGARAAGGPVSPGKSYLVGERGPELIMPRFNGFVMPNHKLPDLTGYAKVDYRETGAARGVTVNVYAKDAVLTRQVRQWVAEGVEIATKGGAVLGAAAGQSGIYRRAGRTIP